MSASSIRAGAAYIELTLRDRVSKPLHAASIALKDFGNSVAWQGAKISAMGAAITAPLAAMTHSFVSAAVDLGRVGNRRDAANVAAYMAALERLSTAFDALRTAVGSALLPLITRWPNTLAQIIDRTTGWVRANRGLLQQIARLGGLLVATGAAVVVVGKSLAMLGTVFGGMAAVVSTIATGVTLLGPLLAALATPIGLVTAAVAGFGAYMLVSTGAAGKAVDWLKTKFGELYDDAVGAWQGIGDALATGDLKLAAEVLWLTLKMEWQKGVNWINQLWITSKEQFVGVWNDAMFGLAMMFTDAWAAIESSWTETVAFMQQGWLTFTGFLSKNLNWAVGEMEKLWTRFRAWLGEDINVEATVKQIDETTKNADAVLDADTKDAKAKTETRRQQRRTDIERTRQQDQDNLARATLADQTDRQAEFNRQRKASEDAVAAASGEWVAARNKAREQRQIADRPTPDDLPAMLGQAQQQLESRGTFSAMAVRGLGADSLAERTAKATEKGADLLKNINDRLRLAGGVFQ